MRLWQKINSTKQILLLACRDLWEHERFASGGIPGYSSLSFSDRLRLDAKAFRMFLCSVAAFRVACLLVIWQLAGYLLVWRWDVQGLGVVAPPLTALLWVLPAVAVIRRGIIQRLLRPFGYRN